MMLRRLGILCPLLVAGGALLAGCTLRQKAPVKVTCVVEATRPGAARPGAGGTVLRVRSLSVAPPYEERGFVYRTSDLGYESDFYREFLVVPRALLTEQVRQWLDASGLFRAVVDPSSKVEATRSLEGHVTALYGDLRDQASPKTVMAIEFTLLSHRTGAPEIIFRRRYHEETPADDRSTEALARAWSKGLAAILGALEADLSKLESAAAHPESKPSPVK